MEFVPVHWLDDQQLRRELADLHRLERAVERHGVTGRALSVRLAELDAEWLRRYPIARNTWPWHLSPATGDALP